MLPDQYYLEIAAAFIRGKLVFTENDSLPPELLSSPLSELSEEELTMLFQWGKEKGLKLHKFKRTQSLPRVRRVLGVLQSIAPTNLLDIGSGRGVFLWPLLDEFSHLPVMAIDHSPQRASDFESVHRGGIDRLTALEMDACTLSFAENYFEVVTMLEVLEHISDANTALAEATRVARRFVILSAPTKEDDNPEHLHLFSQDRLCKMLDRIGYKQVNFDYVPGHLIAVVNVASNR